jgi:hypothetical protein
MLALVINLCFAVTHVLKQSTSSMFIYFSGYSWLLFDRRT